MDAAEKRGGKERHYAFFSNRDCEYYPCHAGVPEERFNCLFCYCPLYALGDACGGSCSYTPSGVKDCSGCTFPHEKDHYDAVIARLMDPERLAAKPEACPY